ncbi:hypothetical protein MCERH3_00025 [Candidatus Nanopelagicaceae bacterium]
MKYAVIGSGPCGSLAALLLLRAGHQVELYDVDSNHSLNSESLTFRMKLVGGSSAPYDIQQILKVYKAETPLGIYRSKISGGFSNVWGSTWGAQPSLGDRDWLKHHKSITNLLLEEGYLEENSNKSCDCFRALANPIEELGTLQNTNAGKTQLALNSAKCDCIQRGRSSCTHFGVWNSKSLISKCSAFDGFSLNTGKDVIRIDKIDFGLLLAGESFSHEFDSVILAAGSIGSVEILLNSLPETPSLSLKDTRMAFLPLLRFGIRTKHKGGFAFSQYSIDTLFGQTQLKAHIQLYSDSEIYRDRILGKIPTFLSPIVGSFLNSLLPHLAIAIIYVDSDASHQVRFRKAEGERKLIVDFLSPMFSVRGLKTQLWKIFRRIGFFPLLPLLSWSRPGESYHLGAVGNQLLDEFGSVTTLPGLHVAGAISLPQIEPGPITHSAMAQTSRLIERLLTKI